MSLEAKLTVKSWFCFPFTIFWNIGFIFKSNHKPEYNISVEITLKFYITCTTSLGILHIYIYTHLIIFIITLVPTCSRAIKLLIPVISGWVFTQYQTLNGLITLKPLTTRRLSDETQSSCEKFWKMKNIQISKWLNI